MGVGLSKLFSEYSEQQTSLERTQKFVLCAVEEAENLNLLAQLQTATTAADEAEQARQRPEITLHFKFCKQPFFCSAWERLHGRKGSKLLPAIFCDFLRFSPQGPPTGGVSNGGVSRSGLVHPFLSFFVLFGTCLIFPGFSRLARGWSGDFPD